jgi:hypothetical protein
MATVELRVPTQLGGQIYEVGIHEIEIVRDWFVDAMEEAGLLIITGEDAVSQKATKKTPPNTGEANA